jgi:hypothetical protein
VCFDWADAVIEVSPDGSDIVSVMDPLDAKPDWTGQLRRTNATRRLLKYDWVYRWERVRNPRGNCSIANPSWPASPMRQ